jgi:hypothetical protein
MCCAPFGYCEKKYGLNETVRQLFVGFKGICNELLKKYHTAWGTCVKIKGRAVPIQAWSGPEGFRKLRFPDNTTTAQDGGKVVSLTHRSPLPPGNAPGTHLC